MWLELSYGLGSETKLKEEENGETLIYFYFQTVDAYEHLTQNPDTVMICSPINCEPIKKLTSFNLLSLRIWSQQLEEQLIYKC